MASVRYVLGCVAVAVTAAGWSCTLAADEDSSKAKALYSEDFRDGRADGWDLESGWGTVRGDDGAWGLRGEGHRWARLGEGPWENARFRLRLRLVRGSVHVNYRVSGPRRYFIGLAPGGLYLSKQTGPHDFSENLDVSREGLTRGRWYDVEIEGRDRIIVVRVDGKERMRYTDDDPLPGGGVALETLDESEVHVDTISVFPGAGAATGPDRIVDTPAHHDDRPHTTVTPQVRPFALPHSPGPRRTKPIVGYVMLDDPAYKWVHTGGPLGGLGYDIRMRPGNPNTMYVTDAWAGVFKSTSGGQNWFSSNGDPKQPGKHIDARTGDSSDAIPVFCLTIDPHNPNTIWAGTQHHRGVFRSTDAGATWSRRESGILLNNGLTFRGFTVHPKDANTVFAAAEIGSIAWAGSNKNGKNLDLVKGALFKTINAGATWTHLWTKDNLARYILINPQNPNEIYVSTGIFDREAANSNPKKDLPGGVGVLKSVDGGKSWNAVNTGLANLYVGSLVMHPENPSILLAGTGCNPYPDGAGVYITENGGKEWHRTLADEVVTSVEFSTRRPNVAYAGTSNAVYRSQDGGVTWRRMTRHPYMWGPPGVRAGWPIDFQVDPRNEDNIFANAYGGGAFLSTDGGSTWNNASQGYTGAQIRRLAVDPKNPNHVYVGGRSGLFVTHDKGGHWQGLLSSPATELDWNGLALDPNDSQHLIAGTNWGAAHLYESHDGGRSWRIAFKLNPKPGALMGWRCIVFASTPSKPSCIYAGTGAFATASVYENHRPAAGVFASFDGGKSWKPANSGLCKDAQVTDLAIDPQYPMLVFAATTNRGVLKTVDGGQNWKAGTGLPDKTKIPGQLGKPGKQPVLSIVIHPKSRGILYCGLEQGGIYRSTDAGASWHRFAPQGISPNANVVDIVVNPARPVEMFAADSFNGVYRFDVNGKGWRRINQGLKMHCVNHLAFAADGSILYAGTEGHGVYYLKLPGVLLSNPPPDTKVKHPGSGGPKPPWAGLIVNVLTRGPRGELVRVPGADIEIRWAGKSVRDGRSDGTGRAGFELPQESYEIRAFKEGFHEIRGPLEVRRDRLEKTVILERAGHPEPGHPEPGRPEPGHPEGPPKRHAVVIVEVGHEVGRGEIHPVPGAQVVIRWASRPIAENRTDRAGRRGFELLQDSYEIRVHAEGFRPFRGPLEVRKPEVVKRVVLVRERHPEHPGKQPDHPKHPDPPPERPFDIVFQVQQPGPRGLVQPAAGAEVVVRFAGEPILSRPTNEAGRANFQLRRGVYQLVINKRGFHQHVSRLEVPARMRPIMLRPQR